MTKLISRILLRLLFLVHRNAGTTPFADTRLDQLGDHDRISVALVKTSLAEQVTAQTTLKISLPLSLLTLNLHQLLTTLPDTLKLVFTITGFEDHYLDHPTWSKLLATLHTTLKNHFAEVQFRKDPWPTPLILIESDEANVAYFVPLELTGALNLFITPPRLAQIQMLELHKRILRHSTPASDIYIAGARQ